MDNATLDRDYPRILVAPPGPNARLVIDKDRQWSSTSYIKASELAVSHGRGPWVEDVDGNRFLDFMAGIAVSATGYSHPKVVKAVQDAAAKFLHICGTDFYYQGMSDLCERLGRLAPMRDKARVFLTNSGTEAIEGAIKLVRNSTRRSDLIAFAGAFHGRSYGAMSLTMSKAKQRASFGPMVPGVHHVPYPNPYRLATWTPSATRCSAGGSGPTTWPRSSSSRCWARGATCCRPRGSSRGCATCATSTGSCWCSTRCRPASGGRAACGRRRSTTSSRTCS
jgi:4-aminobutyrate aminotransferase-like enzyme